MSSDGLRHEGEINAPDKDSAYAALRQRGIHPIKVTERIVPVIRRGFGGLRKRDLVLLVAAVVILVVLAVFVGRSTPTNHPPLPSVVSDEGTIEKMTADPKLREEIRRVLQERRALEEECRARFIRRVEEGTLSRKDANEMFRAMGMEELP